MVDQHEDNFEDMPLTGQAYEAAASRASTRTLTDEQFRYMCSLDAEGLRSYLGREGEDYQERLVTVLKGSFDRAMDKTQTEAAQKLCRTTQSLIKQTHFSEESLSGLADVLYYMDKTVSAIEDGKQRKKIGNDIFQSSKAEYVDSYQAYQKLRNDKRAVARSNANIAKMARQGTLKPLPGMNAAEMAQIASLGHMLQGAGATTSEHVSTVKKVVSKAAQQKSATGRK